MKRLLLLSAGIILACATMAQAELIKVTVDSRENVGSYDKVVLKIVGLDGTYGDALMDTNYVISTIVGTWNANGGTFHTTGTTSSWSNRTLNDGNLQDTDDPDAGYANQTWVDMANKGSTPVPSYTGTFPNPATFTENFYASSDVNGQFFLGVNDTPNGAGFEAFDNTLLGVFYVSHGALQTGQTIWTGTCGFARPGGGGAVGTVASAIRITEVPEPTTLALLASGLFGLLAYAWRKRK